MDTEQKTERDWNWKELDENGKIERLREYVRKIELMAKRIGKLERGLRTHDHLKGKIVFYKSGYDDEIIVRDRHDLCEKCRDNVRI